MNGTFNTIITGLGGQGVVFLTRLLARAAAISNCPFLASETHGLSQRGGPVLTHFKIGGDRSPLIQKGTADLTIALDMNEAIYNLSFLRSGGLLLVNSARDFPTQIRKYLEGHQIDFYQIDAKDSLNKSGLSVRENLLMAGFALGKSSLPIKRDVLRQVFREMLHRNGESAVKALEIGYHSQVPANLQMESRPTKFNRKGRKF